MIFKRNPSHAHQLYLYHKYNYNYIYNIYKLILDFVTSYDILFYCIKSHQIIRYQITFYYPVVTIIKKNTTLHCILYHPGTLVKHQIWNHPIESTYKRFFRFQDDIMLYDILSYAT